LTRPAPPAVRHWRYSNHPLERGIYAAVDTIRHEGVVADSVAPEAKVPMIATVDIAAVAAEALRERNWSGVVVRELLGPRELSYTEAVTAIGAAIGEPNLHYVQLPDEELVANLTEAAGSRPTSPPYSSSSTKH
jgi:uncharacterized protein YbjT (DUF2867 family)